MDTIHERIKQIASENFSLKKILDYAEKVLEFDLTAGELKILIAILEDQQVQKVIELNEKIRPLKDKIGTEGIEEALMTLDKFKDALKKSDLFK